MTTANTVFLREDRYIVIKRKLLSETAERVIRGNLGILGVPTVECVVVEADWPECETVWAMIEARVTGLPTVEHPNATDWRNRAERAEAECAELRARLSPAAGNMDAVKAVARAMAIAEGLNYDEVCGYETEAEECNSSNCIAAYFEDHDADYARDMYDRLASAAIAALQAHPAENRFDHDRLTYAGMMAAMRAVAKTGVMDALDLAIFRGYVHGQDEERAKCAAAEPARERPEDNDLMPHLPESIRGEKRCGIQRSDWIEGWFVPWSPRNENQNAEGPWSHWVALAHAIIEADAKAIEATRTAPGGDT